MTPDLLIKTLAVLTCVMTFARTASAGESIAPGTPRPMCYTPDGSDFVITNGRRLFNRPLYGGNTGFRVDAGDRPEFAFFLPGRGGNLRIGILTGSGSVWLDQAESVVARYRPGSMVYEIRDPLLENETLILTAIPHAKREGLIVKAEMSGNASPVKLVWSFGGANGDRGRRNGDLGGEGMPPGEFFRLKPEYCRGNAFNIRPDGFTLPTKTGTLVGLVSTGTRFTVADASQLASPSVLLASSGKPTGTPLLTGETRLTPAAPAFLAIDIIRPGKSPLPRVEDLPQAFAEAEKYRRSLAERIVVETPDPCINAAAAALGVAADAIWDEKQGAYMHGAVSWRVKLLGWRAAYAGDALGWHDRTRRHVSGFAARQNTTPVPETIPLADAGFNLSRNEAALHSNGDFSLDKPDHYDMNIVAVDTIFRHLMWTGDLGFAATMWPVIERHLARERRLFRRPFGPDKLPLYEAYACIWASDELFYHGGGATHATAYNFWHNRMAARVAGLLGKDPAPYEKEAALIREAMRRDLWLGDRGWYAEFKDFLGNQAVHPSPALWTFYHTLDSDAATPVEAWQMTRFVDTGLAKIPMQGPGVPEGNFNLPTTNWMPYRWSINNVALGESAHTSLACWQAGRPDIAVPLLKGALLDAMFMGNCPGNVGMTAPSDIFSGEQYRDFADAVGITSRAIIEGLFGIQPDQMGGLLRIRPGFPADWEKARIRHPDIDLSFKREGLTESYAIESKLPKPMTLQLGIAALRDHVASVTVNGTPARWSHLADRVGPPHIEVTAPPAARHVVVIRWQGNPVETPSIPPVMAQDANLTIHTRSAKFLAIQDPQGVLKQAATGDHELKAITTGTLGHRTAFVQWVQGDLTWWQPLHFELRRPAELIPAIQQEKSSLRFLLRNNTTEAWSGDTVITIGNKDIRQHINIEAGKDSVEIDVSTAGLVPGSHPVRVDFGNGRKIAGTIVNWKIDPPAVKTRWETIDLTGRFNDRVTQIFRHEYLSPRSPYCSLAIPKQGIGGWCNFTATAEIDDAGLRAASGGNGGVFQSPLGIPFLTPGPDGNSNIIFTSQWDNHPREATIPLSGRGSRACLLMAGSTHAMQCRFENGEVVATYRDGSTARLALESPGNWWPIEQDYHIDHFAFQRPEPVPPRLDLKSARLRVMDSTGCHARGRIIPGGSATILDLPLDPAKELESITVRTLGNEVVIGLMAVTLARD